MMMMMEDEGINGKQRGGNAVNESGAVCGFRQTNPPCGGDKGDKVREESMFLSN